MSELASKAKAQRERKNREREISCIDTFIDPGIGTVAAAVVVVNFLRPFHASVCLYVIFTDLVVAVLKSLGFAFSLAFSLFPKRHTYTQRAQFCSFFSSLRFSVAVVVVPFVHSHCNKSVSINLCCVERSIVVIVVVFRPICSHTACTFHLKFASSEMPI